MDKDSFDFFQKLYQKSETKDENSVNAISQTTKYCRYTFNPELKRKTAETLINKIPTDMLFIAMADILHKYEDKKLPEIIKYISELPFSPANNLHALRKYDDLPSKNIELLKHISDEGWKRRDILGGGFILDKCDVEDIFIDNPEATLKTLKALGEKNFIYSFNEGIDNVDRNIKAFGTISEETPYFQTFLEMINPEASDKYKELDVKIKELKSKFNKTADGQALIKQINCLTHKKRRMVEKSVKDPQDALKIARIYIFLSDDKEYVKKVIHKLNPKDKHEKKELSKLLNKILLEAFGVSGYLDIDFSKSMYLPQFYHTTEEFSDNFSDLLLCLMKKAGKSPLEAFNSMEQNIATKMKFKALGINYDNWVKANPDDAIKLKTTIDTEKRKSAALKNIEEDFNSKMFAKLPDEIKEALFEKLKNSGFNVRKIKVPQYDEAGILISEDDKLQIFKANEPVGFENLKELITIIRKEMSENPLWEKDANGDSETEKAKDEVWEHLGQMRFNELRTVGKNCKSAEIQVQKADMNNIEHSLFLGNDASCCTAVGTGCNQETAPNYIKNKCFSAIEVKDGDKYIGNTMIYLAKVDGVPSLILDNIELKAAYQYNDDIRDAIIEYAKKITKDIGKPDMPIYAGPNRHKVNFNGFELAQHELDIIGSTGEDEIYLDFLTDFAKLPLEKPEETDLYKVA